MIKNREFLEFHIKKLGFDLEEDFLRPLSNLYIGLRDIEYALKLRMIEDKLAIIHCTFEEIGISEKYIDEIKRHNANLYANEIAVLITRQPRHTLNPARLLMLEREIDIAGINLSDILISRRELEDAMPEGGDGPLQIRPWERRYCEYIISQLPV